MENAKSDAHKKGLFQGSEGKQKQYAPQVRETSRFKEPCPGTIHLMKACGSRGHAFVSACRPVYGFSGFH